MNHLDKHVKLDVIASTSTNIMSKTTINFSTKQRKRVIELVQNQRVTNKFNKVEKSNEALNK